MTGRFFSDSTLIQPQAAVKIIDSALAGPTDVGSGDLLVVGVSKGGQPQTPLYFSTPDDLINALKSGDGVRAAIRAFAPGPGRVGAPRVIFVRVNPATQASGTLYSDSGGTLPSIQLTSRDYGALNNNIRVAVFAGTTSGYKLQFQSSPTTVTRDNIGRLGFKARYLGTATGPTGTIGAVSTQTGSAQTGGSVAAGSAVAIPVAETSYFQGPFPQAVLIGQQGTSLAEVVSVTAVSAVSGAGNVTVAVTAQAHASPAPVVPYSGEIGLALNCPSTSGDNGVFSFAAYPTLSALVAGINNIGNGAKWAVVSTAPADDKTSILDAATAVAITKTSPNYTAFNSHTYAIVTEINNSAQPWLNAVLAATPVAPPYQGSSGNSVVWNKLTGALDNEPPLNADWQNALTAAATVDCSVIVVATGDATVHALLTGHVDFESTTSQKHERIALVGGVAGETVTTVVNRVNSLSRDPRVGLVYPGIIDVDTTKPELGPIVLDPWLVAAQLAGMFCGGGIGDALTGKYVTAEGLEIKLTSTDLDNLLEQGVLPIKYVQNKGYKVVQSRSTWTGDTNFRRVELSTMRASDYLSKVVRSRLDDLIGLTVSPETNLLVYQATISTLMTLQKLGVIVGDSRNPAYKNIQVSASGDEIDVGFQVSIAIPANFIFITASLQPYTGTITTI